MQNPARIRMSRRARLAVSDVTGARRLHHDILVGKSGTRRGRRGLILRAASRGLRAASRFGLLRTGYRHDG